MTAPTLTIDAVNQLPFVHDKTMSVKLNQLDVTLVGVATVPVVGDVVAMTFPTWAGTVTGVESTTYDDGTTFYKVTATNAAVLQSGGAAAYDLDDGPPANYAQLVVTRTLSEGVTEVRATVRVLTEGLSPGEEIGLTSAAEGYTAETFTIMDMTTTWPTAGHPVYELALGLGDFDTATAGAGDGGALEPPNFNDYIDDVVNRTVHTTVRTITDTFDRPDGPAGFSDAGIEWTPGSNIVSGRMALVGTDAEAQLTFPYFLPLPFYAVVDLQVPLGVDAFYITLGNLDMEFAFVAAGLYDLEFWVHGSATAHETGSFTFHPERRYKLRVTAEDAGGGNITGRMRIWWENEVEPGSWPFEHFSVTGGGLPIDVELNNEVTSTGIVYIDNLDITGLNALSGHDCGCELDYAQLTTATTNITATSEATGNTVITGNAVTYDGRPVVVEVYLPDVTTPATINTALIITLVDSGTSVGLLGVFTAVAGNADRKPVTMKYRFTPTNASHTFGVEAYVSSGTGIIRSGAGGNGNTVPSFMRITRA